MCVTSVSLSPDFCIFIVFGIFSYSQTAVQDLWDRHKEAEQQERLHATHCFFVELMLLIKFPLFSIPTI